LINSGTFIITPNSYSIPGPSEVELKLTATGLTIYGATIKTNLKTINGDAATCLATVDTVRCLNVKAISKSTEIKIEVKFSI
jgi:hypothetical protein